MTFTFSVQTPSGSQEFTLEPGTSLYFVGANGGGKTRLAVYVEDRLGERAHRISAHRALTLNLNVPKISERDALKGLKFGQVGNDVRLEYRPLSRWGSNAAIQLLNDYDFLIQLLFAEQANVALLTHNNARVGNLEFPRLTKFEKLVEIWDHVLPNRKLEITGDDIRVSAPNSPEKYVASAMSDGERASFYLIGQTLTAEANSLLIFDEPELHIHRAILSRLWDELEAARPDCGMLVISHDLEFVASRNGQKFVLREYSGTQGWTIETVPEDTGFSEEIVTLVLGSRRPVLFVEGGKNSLDLAIYRACYPDWTIIPRGSCEEVIHAVVTMRANSSMTRVTCAGIIDADDYDESRVQFLDSKGVAVLPVSEIENLLLLPDVIDAVLDGEGYTDSDRVTKRTAILDDLFDHAANPKNQIESVMRYCRRRIDRALKKIDLSSAPDVPALASLYVKETGLDVAMLASVATNRLQAAIAAKDAVKLLKWYDNKGILSIAAKAKASNVANFEQWIVRTLRNGTAPAVSVALRKYLPIVKGI